MSWPQAAELVGCPVPTIDWHTRTGRIRTRPFKGSRPTLERESVEEFAVWWTKRQTSRAKKRGTRHERSSGPPDEYGWLDTTQAAQRLEVSREHVPWLAERGVISGLRKGGRWWLLESSVEKHRQTRESERGTWVSQAAAAKIAGCSPKTIAAAAKAGRIDQRRMPRGFPSISRDSVKAFASERRRLALDRERRSAQRPTSEPPDDKHEWLSSLEAAEVLGMSRRRVDQLARRESLPFTQVGRRRWFRRDHIDLVKRARRASVLVSTD
jgi:excisionase family DNA binding protein